MKVKYHDCIRYDIFPCRENRIVIGNSRNNFKLKKHNTSFKPSYKTSKPRKMSNLFHGYKQNTK